MSAALTPLYVTAAIVLAVAGAAKFRAPAGAVSALRTLGMPASAVLVRVIAAGEVLLAGACLLRPATVTAALLAAVYASFAAVSLALARRSSGCGCFGESEAPASVVQSLLSAMLAVGATAAAVAGPRGASWLLAHSPTSATVLALGIAGCAYAIVLAYRELPQAWNAWSSP